MTPAEIADKLAREKRVEAMVQNIAHATSLSQDLRDLCQMVYLVLLTYDPDKIVDLWESGQINFFLARVILTNLMSPRSPYNAQITRFRSRSQPMPFDGADFGKPEHRPGEAPFILPIKK